jgi:DNA-binding MarR family transcriptional regulator
MTKARFDELIHPSTRLSLVATLTAADWAEFAYLKDQLGLSDSALSKQLATLEEAGYVATERRLSGTRRKVRARLTDAGREAFDGHIAALQGIIADANAGRRRDAGTSADADAGSDADAGAGRAGETG